MVHDFYPLNGLDVPRQYAAGARPESGGELASFAHCALCLSLSFSLTRPGTMRSGDGVLRQQFDRCVSALVCQWSFPFAASARSPKVARRDEPQASSPPL